MRISDWSSDVCSSDLAIGRRHASQHPARQKGRGRGGGRGDEQHLRRPPSPVLSEGRGAQSMGSLYRADDLVGQIGRASGRGRVCQYELISVVAVSLKKKRRTTSINSKTSVN